MNHQAEVLFGKEHVPEPNFAAPLPCPDQYKHLDEEELLGVEYALCQSTAFTPPQYYAQRVQEEQCRQDEEELQQLRRHHLSSLPGPPAVKCLPALPPPAPKVHSIVPNKSQRPCGASQVLQCGGMRKRYTPSEEKVGGSSQKLFTFCPKTGKSTTPGFEDVVYTSFEHFKGMVDKELERRNNQQL